MCHLVQILQDLHVTKIFSMEIIFLGNFYFDKDWLLNAV